MRAKPADRFSYAQTPQACREGSCGHYPPLEITGRWGKRHIAVSRKRSASATATLVIDRSDLLGHLARPGGPTDRFDQPLLFLRSGARAEHLSYIGRAGEGNGDNYTQRHGFTPSTSNSDIESGDLGSNDLVADDSSISLPITAKINSLLDLAQSVLERASKLSNLSTSGIFERVICGRITPPELPMLQNLSIGPPPPHWRTRLHLNHPALARVKRLRISGVMLEEEEVRALSMLLSGSLERLEWVTAGRLSRQHPIR